MAIGIGLALSLEDRPGSSALFVLAVVVSTYAGGVLSGIIASVLSYLALDYFFFPPLHSIGIKASSIAPACVFLLTVVVISSLLHREQRAGVRLRNLAVAEREARARSEFLETLAGKLAAATTPVDVAAAAISMLNTVRIPMAAVCVRRDRTIDALAVGGVAEIELDLYRKYVSGGQPTLVLQALRTGRSVEIRDAADLDIRDPDGAALRRQLEIESSAAIPLCGSEAQITGVLSVSSPSPDWPDEGTRTLLLQVADQCGPALERARLLELEHEAALRLQRALLPLKMADRDGVEIRGYYGAGTRQLEVGGDWYDSFHLPGGRLGLCVGDVVGHSIDAAAIMGRLRTALAALAPYCSDPGELLTRLDEYAASRGFMEFATACYAELDPATGILRYASAGHPPPLTVSHDRVASWLEGGRSGPLLGEPDGPRPSSSVRLKPGSFLVMYTDGLIEQRGISIDDGLARLRATALTLSDLALGDFCNRLIADMDAHAADDDVVVLCARFEPAWPIAGDGSASGLGMDDDLVRRVQSPQGDSGRRPA